MQAPWYLDAEEYAWFLEHVDISEDSYVSAVNEVLDIFPIAEAVAYTSSVCRREGGISGPFSVHPAPFHVLARHPILTFVSGMIRDSHILAEIVNLGRDLQVTRSIPGVASIRRDLRNLDQYVGRLFEIEMLAQLDLGEMSPAIFGTPDFDARIGEKRVFIEARHRGVPFARAVTEGIISGLAFKEFGELTVKLSNIGASGETVNEVTERIVTTIVKLLASNERNTVSNDKYEIHHSVNAGPRRLSIHFGKESYDADLKNLIRYTLEDKEKQLAPVIKCDGVKVLALDVRSLFPSLPSEASEKAIAPGWLNYYKPRISRWRASVLEATSEFVRESETTDAVLLWWKNEKGMWPATIKEQFWNRCAIQVVGRHGMPFVDHPLQLQTALSDVTK